MPLQQNATLTLAIQDKIQKMQIHFKLFPKCLYIWITCTNTDYFIFHFFTQIFIGLWRCFSYKIKQIHDVSCSSCLSFLWEVDLFINDTEILNVFKNQHDKTRLLCTSFFLKLFWSSKANTLLLLQLDWSTEKILQTWEQQWLTFFPGIKTKGRH